MASEHLNEFGLAVGHDQREPLIRPQVLTSEAGDEFVVRRHQQSKIFGVQGDLLDIALEHDQRDDLAPVRSELVQDFAAWVNLVHGVVCWMLSCKN